MNYKKYLFDAIGTRWQIDLYQEIPPDLYKSLEVKISERINIFDKDYSRFRDDSLVTSMSEKAGTYKLPQDADPLFTLYRDLEKMTWGSFTALIGDTMIDAGYDARYSLVPKKSLRRPDKWDAILDYSFPTITVKQPAMLDFGAAGKGYLIDIIGDLLIDNGVESFCIDAGRDIVYKNKTSKKLRVGLENPSNTEQVIGVAEIHNQSICASAGNRRAWANFHHIIDPFTLTSPSNILATWAIADNALIADAMTTCLFFTPSSVLQKKYRFEYLILYSDNTIEKSDNFRYLCF
jgi:thiamine biosynthesis lipoprotein